MKRTLYAIYDAKAGDIVGGIHIFPADAVAIRFFGDVAGDTANGQNMIAKHPEDFELIRLGNVYEGGVLGDVYVDERVVVITGSAWKAAQAPTNLEVVK